MKNLLLLLSISSYSTSTNAQIKWENVDSFFQPLPKSIHVFKTTDSLDDKPNIAFFTIIDLNDKKRKVDVDTTFNRRLTPLQFYNKTEQPLIVVNCTFFSFQTNKNLSTVIKNGELISFNPNSIAGKGKDTMTYQHFLGSAIGFSKKRVPDIAWIYSDSFQKKVAEFRFPIEPIKDTLQNHNADFFKNEAKRFNKSNQYLYNKNWKMQTAVGGGPVLIQNNKVRITNNEEFKFAGKALNDKHPRTAIGYTKNNQLIILLVQGRFPGIAEGATLEQLAQILIELNCIEAMNLDGGGSSCLLVNGKETIKPSDNTGQRAIPAVLIIK